MATATIAGIPVYNAIISDNECGMFKISLVDYPAVMSDFLAFSEEKKQKMYFVSDEEKRRVYGVVMRADFPIYRNDPKWGEYYIMYRADTIRVMAEKYLLENRQNDVNIMHEDGSDVEGVQMVQYFIKDSGMGVNPSGFDDIADGSLFAEFHVVNDDVWEAIKEGTYKGFSLEGVFDLVPETDTENVEEIADALEGKFSKIIHKLKNMGKLKRFMAELAKALQELGNVTTDKGVLAWDGDEDLKAGDTVYIEDENGERSKPDDGDYLTRDNKTIVVVDGKVSEIKDPEAEVDTGNDAQTELQEVKTDKGTLHYDGDEGARELKAGDKVYVWDEDGNSSPAPSGDYTTEDGKVIKVTDGEVTEIVDDDAEVATDNAAVAARFVAKMAESYREKERRIYDALTKKLTADSYFYICDAGDDYVVIENVYDIENWTWRYERYSVSWNGTEASVGEAVIVKPVYVPEDFDTSTLFNVQTENATLRAELEKLQKKPLAKPAHVEMQSGGQAKKTGVKGLDKIAYYASLKK